MTERFDVIVIGMGPGGETVAGRLLAAGRRVAVVERELIGGECAYWACIPSKTLLRPLEAQAEAAQAAGLSRPERDWAAIRDYRNYMIRHLDDTAQVAGYEKAGATVIKGAARLTGPGRVQVDRRELAADHIVLATGSEPARPPVHGLGEVPVWTNREATTSSDIPGRALFIGGSAVGTELGQFFARMGTQVTIVQRGPRLLDREEPRVGALAAEQLTRDGVTLHVGAHVVAAHRDGPDTVAELDDGSSVRTDVIVLAAGRRPRADGLGLDTVGVRPGAHGVPVDRRCQVTDGVWALGDLTGVALFTHVAKYQGRVVADNILGRPRAADYTGVPRVVFTEPEIAAVGLTATQARDQGIDIATAELALAESITRPWTYQTRPGGTLGLVADRRQRVLVGAWAVAPLAGEWIHQAALAIRAKIPLDALLDGIAQFPTYSEAYLTGIERLDL